MPINLRKDPHILIKDILSRHIPGKVVWAFGSRVNGRAKPFSDLDLLIKSNDPIDSVTLFNLKDALSESDLPFRVDIVEWNSISEEFKAIILGGYEVFAG